MDSLQTRLRDWPVLKLVNPFDGEVSWRKVMASAALGVAFMSLLNIYKKFTRVLTWNLKGKVIIVTGASRGVGRGVALALAHTGATLYLTARTVSSADKAVLPGTLEEVVALVKERGGNAIPVKCDHTNDQEIKALFDLVSAKEGRLDCLVNNVILITEQGQTPPFWTQGTEAWDGYHKVGLRAHYIASQFAVPLMLETIKKDKENAVLGNTPVIVNINSLGAERYLFNVAYGSSKAALHRMTKDMAVDLSYAKTGISVCGMWPGVVATERMLNKKDAFLKKFHVDVTKGESPEYTGRAIAALLSDKSRIESNGKIYDLYTLARKYNFTDIDGKQHVPTQSMWFVLQVVVAYLSRKVGL